MNLEPRVSCALHNSLPRAKDGKRQKWLELDVQAIFSQSLRVQQVAPTSLYKGGKKDLLFYAARFSHFIDSLRGELCSPLHIFNFYLPISIYAGLFLLSSIFDLP